MTGRGRGRGTFARWSAKVTLGKCQTIDSTVQTPQCESETSESFDPAQTLTDSKEIVEEDSNELHIRVTHVLDVEHFWAQLGMPGELEKFDKYLYALRQWCDKQLAWTDSGRPAGVVTGQMVCVRCASTGTWERGQVTRLSDHMVEVFFLDSGSVESLTLDSLCSNTPADLTSYAPQAQYCTLADVQPCEESWSEEANARFKELVSLEGQKLIAHKTSNKLSIYLRDRRGVKVSVSSILIREGFAKSSSCVTRGESTSLAWSHLSNNFVDKQFYQGEDQSDVNTRTELPSFPNPSSMAYNQQVYMTDRGYPQTLSDAQPVEIQSSEDIKNVLDKDNIDDLGRKAQIQVSSNFAVRPPPGFAFNIKPHQSLQGQNRTQGLSRSSVNVSGGHNVIAPQFYQHDARPHLSGPAEFVAHPKPSRVQTELPNQTDSQKTGNDWKASGKYIPPALRSKQTREEGTLTLPSKLNTSFQAPAAAIAGQDTNLHNQFPHHEPLKSQSNRQPFLIQQPIAESNQDKIKKNELEWQKFKFQRKVSQIFRKLTLENVSEHIPQLKKIMSERKLSSSFHGLSETLILLQLIAEKTIDEESFVPVAVQVCLSLYGDDVPDFCNSLECVMSEYRDELTTSYTISNYEAKCGRFCLFLGQLFELVQEQDQESLLVSTLYKLIKGSIDIWLNISKQNDVRQSELLAFCVGEILAITGPGLEETDSKTLHNYFMTIRELVLSADLERETKSRLLDLLLLRASGWIRSEDRSETEEKIAGSNSNEVLVEDQDEEYEANDVDENECYQTEELENEDENDSEWDPYFRVKKMLKSLRLENLLEKFQENCIRDSLLNSDCEELRNTLKDAAFPPGVILEMKYYLEKEAHSRQERSSGTIAVDKKKKSFDRSSKPQRKENNQSEQYEPKQELNTTSVSANKRSSIVKLSESRRHPVPSDEKPPITENKGVNVEKANQELHYLKNNRSSNGPVGANPSLLHPQSAPRTTGQRPTPYSGVSGQESNESLSMRQKHPPENTRSGSPTARFSFPPPPDIGAKTETRKNTNLNATSPYPLPCPSVTTTGSTPSYSEILKLVSPSDKSPPVHQTWTLQPEQKAPANDQKNSPITKGLVPPRPGKGAQPPAEKKETPKRGIMKTPPGIGETSLENLAKNPDVPSPKQSAQFKGVRFSSHVETRSPSDALNWRDSSADRETITSEPFSEGREFSDRNVPVQHYDKIREGTWDMGYARGERFSTPPAEPPKPTPFGLKGPKACTLCGSTDHRESSCTDRSNWFMD